jgi:hypothetical protein
MARPDMESVEVLVHRFYFALLSESGPEAVQSFDLLPFVYTKE